MILRKVKYGGVPADKIDEKFNTIELSKSYLDIENLSLYWDFNLYLNLKEKHAYF